MKHLVYAILREPEANNGPFPEGVEGHTVAVVADAGLAAVFSELPVADTAPDVPRLLAYARVIEALSRRRVVLPLRYGCMLDTTVQIRELLRRRCQAFHAALQELDGCVEMGLRILLPESNCSPDHAVEERSEQRRQQATSGVAYLAQRNRYYARKDGGREEVEAITEQIKTALAGLFVNCRSEASARNQATLLSLYFLVRSENVERFREACHRLQQTFPEKALPHRPVGALQFCPLALPYRVTVSLRFY